MKLSSCVIQFVHQYLPHIKGSSRQTIRAYQDNLARFLPFAADTLAIKTTSLRLEHLTPDLVIAFLDHLESERKNSARTRNHRLAAIKSLAKMIRFMYPEHRDMADRILHIPQKRFRKKLVGYLHTNEIFKVFESVDIKRGQGYRDYTILNLLYDSGARASEVATLNLDYFDPQHGTLAILGKGNRYRQIELLPKTSALIFMYIRKYRKKSKLAYQQRLFINQRGQSLTRHGIHRLCKKYLQIAMPESRLKNINPAHSFRHACAVRMLTLGHAITDIKNRLGHENIQSTMIYLDMDLSRKREVQRRFIEYTQSTLADDTKIEALIDWENKESILAWLDSL
jgi:site-specific recombinase XerD